LRLEKRDASTTTSVDVIQGWKLCFKKPRFLGLKKKTKKLKSWKFCFFYICNIFRSNIKNWFGFFLCN
jgi:hypothetical protein